jgi:hypothetical protein
MVYFKQYESQLPVVERALYVASRMVGTERLKLRERVTWGSARL